MRKISVLVGLFILCTTLSAGNLYAAGGCNPSGGKIEVSKITGGCNSIQSAIDAAGGTNPVVISVLPGTYNENITMKGHIHLQGAGKDVTTIQPTSLGTAIYVGDSLVDVEISDFTIRDASVGIWNYASSPTITRNIFKDNEYGVYSQLGSSPFISDNIFVGDRNCTSAIWGQGPDGGSPKIINNTITDSVCNGIWVSSGSPTIRGNKVNVPGHGIGGGFGSDTTVSGNIVTGNTTQNYGLYIVCSSGATPAIINNRVAGNTKDINMSCSSANVSFNVFDNINGTWTGNFNVHSNGSAW